MLALFVVGARREPPRPVVCIDPGHPSEVSLGNERINSITEAHADWVVAMKLRDELEGRGLNVCVTRDREDTLVRNRDRIEYANRMKATLLVRLHCDLGRDSGFAVYYPDREGAAEGHRGPSVRVRGESERAAIEIHASMAEMLGGLHDGGLLGESKTYVGEKQGVLTGSVFSHVAVVTVEMVVLSNPRDAAFIRSDSGTSAMADAIASGVAHYLAVAR